MKNDSKFPWAAEVEVAKVKFQKGKELGIDFSNNIDAWSKMEFKFRHQIRHLRQHGSVSNFSLGWKDLSSLPYAIRQKID